MKTWNFPILIFILVLFSACNSDNRRKFNTAVEYNDFIINMINSIDSVYMDALDVDKGYEFCKEKSKYLTQLSEENIKKLKDIQPYEQDSTLTMQAIAYNQFMANNGAVVLPKFLSALENYTKEASDEKAASLETDIFAEGNRIDQRYQEEIGKLQAVQKTFADKYNVIILP